ncbi:MAG: PQQ-binding-like beta-propeller repeat protein [Acidobacteria bacterium]|nr:PQQ-binding-like beta-propeller repeat protein [Acidobacteriota bacterium]
MKKHCTVLPAILLVTAFLSVSAQTNNAQLSHWPQWRGPDFNGMARSDAPLKWSDTENVKWKAAIPGRGFSTPIVWGEKIFLTTAIPTGKTGNQPSDGRHPNGGAGANQEQQFVVMCLEKKSGKVLWQKTAKTAVPHEGYHRMYGSHASNAPVTDGKNVYAFFGSRGVYCYDLDGKLIWEKDLGVKMRMRNEFGEGTAAVVHGDTLILNFDQESDSFIVTLDKHTGKELWRKKRDEVSAWATPLVIEHAGRPQVVVSATGKVRSYDLSNGKVIWECAGLGLNAIPAPIYHDGVLYAMTGFRDPKLMAIKLGREGDLTGTDAVLWSETRGTSYTPSPLLHDGKLYTLTDNGQFSCFDAKTGKPYYHRTRLPKPYNFKASPVGANGKIYLATEEGDIVVVKMGETFEVLATNTLEDQTFIASPVIINDEIFLRGQNTLFCISEKK